MPHHLHVFVLSVTTVILPTVFTGVYLHKIVGILGIRMQVIDKLLETIRMTTYMSFNDAVVLAAKRRYMCRNIKRLFNFQPPATEVEIRDASLQFVKKLSGFSVPSRANKAAFDRASVARFKTNKRG
jgi:hypothetical protein